METSSHKGYWFLVKKRFRVHNMQEGGADHTSKLLGLINLMFYLIVQKADDKTIEVAYRYLIELEKDENVRIKLMLNEGQRNFKNEFMILISKLSVIDNALRSA